MDHSLTMDIDQPPSSIFQLDKSYSIVNELEVEMMKLLAQNPTRSNRFVFGCALTKSLMFPFAIQSDTIAN